jgi:hypothetical protein
MATGKNDVLNGGLPAPLPDHRLDNLLETVVSELLCFLEQKCNLLPLHSVVNLCVDFYSLEDIEQGRLFLTKYIIRPGGRRRPPNSPS